MACVRDTGTALNGLNMNVPEGAIYGLIGKNGAGKTTLIRIVCGLQLPTSGHFTLYGAGYGEPGLASARRRTGAVVETPSLYVDMTAEQNLKLQNRTLGLPDDANIPELLCLVGLENTGRKKVRNFSLGMRQRLGIAVALCGSPDFLILDEPINGLDPQGIIDVRELILKLNREHQVTVLISTHILDELSRIATHYGFIDRGHSEKAVDVYGKLNIARLATELDRECCELLEVQEKDESLESYFLSLVGGNNHE